MTTLKVLILEDEPLTCHALKMALDDFSKSKVEYHFQVEICNTYHQSLERINRGLIFDLAILDINLGSNHTETGEDFAKVLRSSSTGTKVVFLTSISERFRYYSIFKKINPEGFIIKSELDFFEIKNAIQKVLNGETYFSKSISVFLKNEREATSSIDETDRTMLFLLSKGASTKDLVEKLNLSASGIEWRKRKLAKILGLKTAHTPQLLEQAKSADLL